jgi:hypothetical protein
MAGCAMCNALEQGEKSYTFTPDTNIEVCQGHWNLILAEYSDGPYMNLPPGRVRLI